MREQMRDHLGIGFGHKTALALFQLGFEFLIILNNSIVHHSNFIRHMRVGILLRRAAMRGPAGMANAEFPR